jgi:hypothetical protein
MEFGYSNHFLNVPLVQFRSGNKRQLWLKAAQPDFLDVFYDFASFSNLNN